MDQKKREMIEKFFKKASVIIEVDGKPSVTVNLKGNTILIDVQNPLALMSLGLDLDMIKKDNGKGSVIRKTIKDMGYKIKLKYKFFEFEL